jgi:hypothetical protein
MAQTDVSVDARDTEDRPHELKTYLPATPQFTSKPSIVEEFVTTLFRRRDQPLLLRRPKR